MDKKRRIHVSKYLSKHLRHQPKRLGLVLEPGGWVEVAALLSACAAARFPISREELNLVVARCDKQRYAFDACATRIRANQGHSTAVDLELEPRTPPAELYHGTGAAAAVASILATGLIKMQRHHVHLSHDLATARRVGARHGRPVVFAVAALTMHEAGLVFFQSANGVWLVDSVPPGYLRQLDDE